MIKTKFSYYYFIYSSNLNELFISILQGVIFLFVTLKKIKFLSVKKKIIRFDEVELRMLYNQEQRQNLAKYDEIKVYCKKKYYFCLFKKKSEGLFSISLKL